MSSAPETGGDVPHVADLVLDYVEGRLTPQQSRDVEAHLATCDSCAADYRWASELRSDAERAGLRHLSPERIVALSQGAVTNDEATHLAACESCRAEIEWARRVPLPPLRVEGAARPSWLERLGGLLMARYAWGLGAAAAAIALLVFFRTGDDPTRLARIEALPAPAQRGVPTPGSFEEAFANGLARYAQEDWRGAEAELEKAATLAPQRPEAHLYLGSVRLLQGRMHDATASLTRAKELTETPDADPRVAEEARWQLAQALLKQGDTEAARALLTEIRLAAGRRSKAAGVLLEQVDHAAGRRAP